VWLLFFFFFFCGDDEVSSDVYGCGGHSTSGMEPRKYYVIGTTKFDVRRIGQWESIENEQAVTLVVFFLLVDVARREQFLCVDDVVASTISLPRKTRLCNWQVYKYQ
jgi:hypothetical protein